MPASSQRRRHVEGATIICHPHRRARPALPGKREKLHVRPVPRRAARGLVPARCGAGGAQGRGGTGRHLRKRAAPKVQYSLCTAPNTLQSRSPFFFDLFASRGFIEGAYTAYEGTQRHPGAASRALACRRRAAPGNAPRSSDAGAPDAIDATPPAASRQRAELEVTTTTTLRAPPHQGPRRRRTRPQITRAAISNTPPARFQALSLPTPQILKYRRPFWR